MKLNVSQQAPPFSVQNIFGATVSLGGAGNKNPTLLTFMRFVGCPVCNLRTAELMRYHHEWQEAGLRVIVVYESSVQKMQEYVADMNIPFAMLADPDEKLYKLYRVERSLTTVAASLFQGGLMKKALDGNKLYVRKPAMDGHIDRIGADFLIDAHGVIRKAHYGSFIGDHIPVEEVTTFAGTSR